MSRQKNSRTPNSRSSNMARAPLNFRQGDLARALKAARAAGFDRVEFDPATGRYLFHTDDTQNTETLPSNYFDEKLKHGQDGHPEPSPIQESVRKVDKLLSRSRP
jgi:hypothetical protein